jgi:8-oxo-dGTP diphosphatase
LTKVKAKAKTKRTGQPAPVVNSDGEPAVLCGVAAVIVNDAGKMLFGRRRGTPDEGGGALAAPGGKMRAGESFAEAVRREVLEETGLEVQLVARSQVNTELFVVNHRSGSQHYVTVFVECRVTGGKLENREPHKCAGWSWLSFADMTAHLPPDAAGAWQRGEYHPALCWMPVPQLSYYREHLGLK